MTPRKPPIEINPKVHHGQPVIAGTRVPIAILVGSLAAGMSFEEVEREYGVSRDDIRAALAFAADLLRNEQHHSLAV